MGHMVFTGHHYAVHPQASSTQYGSMFSHTVFLMDTEINNSLEVMVLGKTEKKFQLNTVLKE
jgi:hypothetical protein